MPIGFGAALAIAFIVLKLTHVIAWSWWWVTAPLWAGAAVSVVVIGLIIAGVAAFGRTSLRRAKR